MRRLNDQRILITGAGSGLGRELALRFAGEGWRVACSDRLQDTAAATVATIAGQGGTAMALTLDVTDAGAFEIAFDAVERDWGGVDVVVNNAGVATAGTVEESPLAQWDWVLDINLMGCVRGSRAAIPRLRRAGGGHIVNVASFAGIANPPAMASYNVAKAGVISLSETLRFELAPLGIGVSVACPSFFATSLIETSRAAAPDGDAPSPPVENIVRRLMQKAEVTAAQVADDIFDAVRKDRFLVITHPDARQRWHLKRLAPETYFKLARKATEKFLGNPASGAQDRTTKA